MMYIAEDSHQFYDNVIMPYKGLLEEWYVANQGMKVYFLCILVTAWVVLFRHSSLVWRIFHDLPAPPKTLRPWLHYTQ